jgi:hypothetical protein
MPKKKVCCDCEYSILNKEASPMVSKDGLCWNCEQYNWQDESVCLACKHNDEHGCRGWGAKCSEFKRKQK